MFIQQISHNRRRQVALGTVSLALAGISALTVINAQDTASLASPAKAHRMAVGQSASGQSVVAEQAAAATLASASKWTTGTARWLAQQRYGLAFVGSAVQASFAPTSASAEQASAGSPAVQCSMSSHTATRNGSIVSLCLNPNVTVPSLSGTVQRVRSMRHVSVTTPLQPRPCTVGNGAVGQGRDPALRPDRSQRRDRQPGQPPVGDPRVRRRRHRRSGQRSPHHHQLTSQPRPRAPGVVPVRRCDFCASMAR